MNLTETIVIEATPAEVWRVGGDIGNTASWCPGIDASYLEGDLRHVVFSDGRGPGVERILSVDDDAHAYVYDYVSGPIAVQHFRARFEVLDHPDGSEVRWSADVETGDPAHDAAAEPVVRTIYREALDALPAAVAALPPA